MKENDIRFFKIIAIVICLAVCTTSGVLIYNNIDHRTLNEYNDDYIRQYGK